MLLISETTLESLSGCAEDGFIDRVDAMFTGKMGLNVDRREWRVLLTRARERMLGNERDCAAFMALSALLRRQADHGAWAEAQIADAAPLDINAFVHNALARSATVR